MTLGTILIESEAGPRRERLTWEADTGSLYCGEELVDCSSLPTELDARCYVAATWGLPEWGLIRSPRDASALRRERDMGKTGIRSES